MFGTAKISVSFELPHKRSVIFAVRPVFLLSAAALFVREKKISLFCNNIAVSELIYI